jgi:hypothetical protein
MASLANFTLLEKTEILEKSKIGEHVKDSVMKSPVASKIYKYKMKSVRQPAKVNVYLNNCKRSISTFPNSPLLLRTGRFVISKNFSSHPAYKILRDWVNGHIFFNYNDQKRLGLFVCSGLMMLVT